MEVVDDRCYRRPFNGSLLAVEPYLKWTVSDGEMILFVTELIVLVDQAVNRLEEPGLEEQDL